MGVSWVARPLCADAEMGGMCGGGMTAEGEWVLDHTFYANVETHPSMPEFYTKPQEVQ